MATKYAALRGKIPEAERPLTDKERKILEVQSQYPDRSWNALTAEFNRLEDQIGKDEEALAKVKLQQEAVERLLQKQLEIDGADSIRMNGYTWSPTCEPYPSAEDPAAIIQYFKENNMEDQLTLKAGELATRLKTFVKEEALAGELSIEEVPVVDESTGVEKTVTVVRSKIPGVKVFLKTSLSRTKSNK